MKMEAMQQLCFFTVLSQLLSAYSPSLAIVHLHVHMPQTR